MGDALRVVNLRPFRKNPAVPGLQLEPLQRFQEILRRLERVRLEAEQPGDIIVLRLHLVAGIDDGNNLDFPRFLRDTVDAVVDQVAQVDVPAEAVHDGLVAGVNAGHELVIPMRLIFR